MKNIKKPWVIIAAVLALALAAPAAQAGPNAGASIALDLDPNTQGIQSTIRANVNDVLTVNVWAQDAVNLAGIDFLVQFDPALLQCTGRAKGGSNFLESLGGTTFFGVTGTPTSGTAGLSGAILAPTDDTTPEGDGIIGVLTFKVLSTNTAPITFTKAEFAINSTTKDNILAAAENATVNPPIGISGQVTGGAGGTVYVAALSDLWAIPPVAETQADGSGNFLLTQDEDGTPLPNGSYYIVAWEDTDGNQMPSYDEMQGIHGAPPTQVAFSGTDVTGIGVEVFPTTGVGPHIESAGIIRINLPGGIGPTQAAGLHGNFDVTLAGDSAAPAIILVKLPDGGAAYPFPDPLTPEDGGYELFQDMGDVIMPDGNYTVLVADANHRVDITETALATPPGDMPAAPVLTAPAAGALLTTSLPTFTWTGGNEGSYQELLIDDEATFAEPMVLDKDSLTTGAYTLAGGEALADGSYWWSAGVADASGENINYAAPLAFSVDTGAPTLAMTAPAANAYATNPAYNVAGTAGDGTGTGLAKVEVSLDNGATWHDATGTTNWTYAATLVAGANSIKARATDLAGNTTTAGPVVLILDAAAPTLAMDTPAANAYVTNPAYNVAGTAGDGTGTGLARVEVSLDNGATWHDATGTTNWTYAATLVAGANNVLARASDLAGNTTMVGPVVLTLDANAPALAMTAPAANAYATNPAYNVAGTAGDGTGTGLARVEVSLDNGATWQDATGTTNWTYAATLVAGANSIKARATDLAGNTTTVGPVVLTLDATAPVTTPTPAAGTYGAAQDVTLAAVDALSGVASTNYHLYAENPANPVADTPYAGAIPLAAPVDPDTVKEYWLAYQSTDNAGNAEAIGTAHYVIDTGAPVTNVTLNPAANLVGGNYYATAAVTVTLSSPDSTIYYDSGVNAVADPTTASTFFAGTGDIVLPLVPGVVTHYVVKFFAVDQSPPNLSEIVRTVNVYIDPTVPATTATGVPAGNIANANFTVTLTSDEAANIKYTLDGTDPAASGTAVTAASPVDVNFATEGTFTLKFFAQDAAGNAEATQSLGPLTLDKTAPVTTADKANNFISNADFTVALTASETAAITYTTDGSDPKTSVTAVPYAAPINFNVEGAFSLKFFARDPAGNTETTRTLALTLDKTAPNVAITAPAANAYVAAASQNVTGTAGDGAGAGLAKVEVSINDGAWQNATGTAAWTYAATLAVGANNIKARATDLAGNTATTAPVTLTYHPPLALSIDGVNVTGTTISVPNQVGQNVRIINVTGGTGVYNTTQTDGGMGAMVAPGGGTPLTFTATLGAEGTTVLTFTDANAPTVYTATLTINVVNFGITGPNHIVLGQTQNYTALGSTGQVQWTADPATIAGAVVTSGTLKENAAIRPLLTGDFLLTATDTALSVSQSMTVTAVNPIDVTPKGYGVFETFTQQYAATGGSGTYTFTVDPARVGYFDTQKRLITLDVADPLPLPFTVTAQDKKYPALTASATGFLVPPMGITGPAGNLLYKGATFDFTATGGFGSVTWTASQGTIDKNTGHFVPPTMIQGQTQVQVVVTAHNTTYGNLYTYVRINVYGDVLVTGSDSEPPVSGMKVTTGRTSDQFHVSGGLNAFTWNVTGPGGYTDTLVSNAYTFRAPTAGAFAGPYTIAATDGNSTDSFLIYVPISLKAVDNDTDLNPIPPNFHPGETQDIYAQGSNEPLSVTVAQKPFVKGATVLANVPTTAADATFTVDAHNKGEALVKVREASDTGSKWAGWLRVSVLPPAVVHGAVSNIPAGAGAQEVTVTLINPASGALYQANPVAGAYQLNGVEWGTYRMILSADVAGYAPYAVASTLVVVQEDVTKNLALPNLPTEANAHTVTVTAGGDYTAFSPYTWRVVNANGLLFTTGSEADDTLVAHLTTGQYRIIITGKGYRPWDSGLFSLTGDQALNANLVNPALVDPLWPGYDPARKIVAASHIYWNDEQGDEGFTLRVVTRNIGAYGMGMATGLGNLPLVHGLDYTGSGTAADPYVYRWDTDMMSTSQAADTPRAGDTQYQIQFYFTDGVDQVPYEYTVSFVEYGTANNQQADKPQDLKDLETETETRGAVQASGEVEFYPLDGSIFDLWLPDPTGAPRRVTVTIPSLPLDALYLDNYDVKGKLRDNLGYSGELPSNSDYYNIPVYSAKEDYDSITADDLLRVEASYYSLGPDTVGTGIALDIYRVEDGNRVRYNPILSNNQGREVGPPAITVPVLLNPSAPFFDAFLTLGQASGRLRMLVSERGDGTEGYKVETMPFIVQEDGLLQLSASHLTSFGQAIGATGGGGTGGGATDDTTSGASDGDRECFLGSTAPNAGNLAWFLGAALLALSAGLVRRFIR